MKVLCLYNHSEYGAPMVRSASAFDAFDIDMTVVQVSRPPDEATCLRAIKPYSFDVLLLQEPPVYDSLLDCGKPVVLLERVDGAQLRAARQYLSDDRVVGVIKSYVFRDRSLYNTVPDRAHVKLLTEAGITCEKPIYDDTPPTPVLSDVDLAKLRAGYSGFGCHDLMRACIETPVDFSAPRPIDVHFAGTVDYESSEVETHRRLALQAAETWPGRSVASAGRIIPRPAYNAGIVRSKTVLCPWGWGEATYREYEAMALGAVVIKPRSEYVECWPDIYKLSRAYVDYSVDSSDIHEAIAEVVDDWEGHSSMRARARQMVVDAWQPEVIAKRMATLLKELVL